MLLEGLEAGYSVVGTVFGIGWDTRLGIGVGLQGAELIVVLPVFCWHSWLQYGVVLHLLHL